MRAFRIALPAADLGRSIAFYESLLGVHADDTVPSRVYFHCGDVIVAIIDGKDESHGERPALHPLPDHLYFATNELDAVYERAVLHADITSPIAQRPWGERSFYCKDPDGHPLCFVDDATLFLGRGADWS